MFHLGKFSFTFFLGKITSFSNFTPSNKECFLWKSSYVTSCVILPAPLKLNFNYVKTKWTKDYLLNKQKPFLTGHLKKTHKTNTSTQKTTKCGKIMKPKSSSNCSPVLQQKITPTVEPCDHCHQSELTVSCWKIH